ncbi:MgtC/SapB family protein [Lederbergia panacisoli]|uniref:MgtC/SapB family protein n=1 Tax=Lederbergia panacisoli TaxID=1255251 RepID=UPI00214C4EFA|nr:MgtC/SapB family protein [Lederbergia panacisoli]MCR2822996.1 MgtC/SapB family protein [Lederbergia panacisoli]
MFVEYEIYFKILISAILGFLIGWDRTSKHKPAGLKTYTYVAVACTLLTLISIVSVEKYSGIHENVRVDPLRLAAQIVSGLGFLGAGVILKDGLQVKGLTSASMIFFVGGVGIGIGAGFYGVVIFATFLTFILAHLGVFFEKKHLDKETKTSTLSG